MKEAVWSFFGFNKLFSGKAQRRQPLTSNHAILQYNQNDGNYC